jgi:hypothetical protein
MLYSTLVVYYTVLSCPDLYNNLYVGPVSLNLVLKPRTSNVTTQFKGTFIYRISVVKFCDYLNDC